MAENRKGKRTGPREAELRAVGIMVRVTPHERSRFARCAAKLGLSVSSWMRMNLLEAVDAAKGHEARNAGRDRSISSRNQQGR
jgi:hypothetical protein